MEKENADRCPGVNGVKVVEWSICPLVGHIWLYACISCHKASAATAPAPNPPPPNRPKALIPASHHRTLRIFMFTKINDAVQRGSVCVSFLQNRQTSSVVSQISKRHFFVCTVASLRSAGEMVSLKAICSLR